MKKFVIDLFSNRFGIVLAALNVCYLAAKIQDIVNIPQTFLGKVFVCLNIPAFILSRLAYKIDALLFGEIKYSIQISVKLVLFTLFIILQWLVIAWIARTIAVKIRKPIL